MNRNYQKFQKIDLEFFYLEKSAFSVFLQHETSVGSHALVTLTSRVVSVHFGVIAGRFSPVATGSFAFDQFPHLNDLHDGHGFNLPALNSLLFDLSEENT